jgi:hypothetical protein
VLFGGHEDDAETREGGRISAGFWLDEGHCWGIGGGYFQLSTDAEHFAVNSNTTPIIVVPFFDQTGAQRRLVVSYPGFSSGSFAVDADSRFNGYDVYLLGKLYCCDSCRIYGLVGYSAYNLDEDVRFHDNITNARGRLDEVDIFATRNHFNGGEVGILAQYCHCKWSAELRTKVSLGCTDREVNVNGATTFTVPPSPIVTRPGSFFALPSNIGRRTDDTFSAIPELNVNVGYQITDHLRGLIGYSFIYWPNVARAGDQVDSTVNLTQLPTLLGPGTLVGPARPSPALRESSFWAHGLNFGLEFRY